MFRLNLTLLGVLLAVTIGIAGCGKSDASGDSAAPSGPAAAPATDDSGAGAAEDPKIAEALAKLSPADQEAAQKQKTCPVSGALLGSMGTPVKVTVKGQEVFLCCKGCEGAIKEDPDKYLKKLK